MSEAAKSAVLESGFERGGRWAVLMAFAHWMRPPDAHAKARDEAEIVKVSTLTLASYARLKLRQTQSVIKALREDGLIELAHSGGAGPGDANGYTLPFVAMVEPVAMAIKTARRTVYAGCAKAVLESGLNGAEITPDNCARMIWIAGWSVYREGHEKEAKIILAYGGFSLEDMPPKGCSEYTLSKGAISDIRVQSEGAKGAISDIFSLYSPRVIYIARVGAREEPLLKTAPEAGWAKALAGVVAQAIFETGQEAEAARWLEGLRRVELVLASQGMALAAEALNFVFPERSFEAHKFADLFGSVLRQVASDWAGSIQIFEGQNRREWYRGRGGFSLEAVATAALRAQAEVSDAA